MVEGIAEALILPGLAKAMGGSLKKSAVTIVNADGINFNAFLPLFGKNKLGIPIAVLTDGDGATVGAEPSATAKALKAQESEISNLRVEYCPITFEHELARSPKLLNLMLDSFENLHPINGKALRDDLKTIEPADERAGAFYQAFKDTDTSKGSFAQELSVLLDSASLTREDVPKYIRNAFGFLGVIETGGPLGTSGASIADNVPDPASH
jgi:putative ATP-dependent endonuclease of the OLD family